MLWVKIINDLHRRKLRTILTIIGLAISVVGISGFSVLNASVHESTKAGLSLNAQPDALIYVRDAEWNKEYINGINEIQDYELLYLSYSFTYINNEFHIFQVQSTDLDRVLSGNALDNVVLVDGRLPEKGKLEALIDQSAANIIGIGLGDTIHLNVTVQNKVTDITITIVGFGKDTTAGGYAFNKRVTLWMYHDEWVHILGKGNLFNYLYLVFTNKKNLEHKVLTVCSALNRSGVFVNYYYVFSADHDSDWRNQIMNIVDYAMSLVSVFGLCIGGLLAVNTVQSNIVMERKNLALLRIIGAKKRHLFVIYLSELFLLGLLGGGVGVFLSLFVAYWLLQLVADPLGLVILKFIVPVNAILLGFIATISSTLIFSIPTLLSVTRVSPAETFKQSNHEKLELMKFNVSSTLLLLSLRSLLKRKRRLFLNVLVIGITVGVAIGFQASTVAIRDGFIDFYDTFPSDIMIGMQSSENQTFVSQVLDNFIETRYPNEILDYSLMYTRSVDLFLDSIADYTWLQVIGCNPEKNYFKAYSIVKGHWFTENENNTIVLTRRLHDKLNGAFDVGSTVTIRAGILNTTFRVVGIVEDSNNGGHMAYTSISNVQSLVKEWGKVNTGFLRLKDRSHDVEIARALSNDPQVQSHVWHVTPISYWKEYNLNVLNFFFLFGYTVSFLAVLVAIIGGVNSFLMAVLERKREIALLKLIGGSPNWIIKLFLLEALLLGIVSGVIGDLVARFIIVRFIITIANQSLYVPEKMSYLYWMLGIGFSLFVSLLTMIYPSWQAKKTVIALALRYED